MSEFSLEGKTAVVTGAAGGIGSEIVREYAKAGANVVLAGRNKDNLRRLEKEINDGGASALAVATDVCDPAEVANLVNLTVTTYGTIDILVNNAGGARFFKPPETLSFEEWREVIDLNLSAPFLCAKLIGEIMREQMSGKIINISSVAGIKGAGAISHYSAAKGGLISLSKSLASAWSKYNIHVNCIAPGLTKTPGIIDKGMLPSETDEKGNLLPRLNRPSDPVHTAYLAVFLASAASDHLTGETIPIRAMVGFDR
jgi:3-oxoacyl-[acyl-carrier protein] reductase